MNRTGAGFVYACRWYGIAVLVIVLDQLTKNWASAELTYATPYVITDFFNFTLLHNKGAAFSFLSDAGGWQRWFFTIVAAVVSAVLAVWLIRLPVHKRMEAIAIALVLGGALGNLYDRVMLGYVVDFLDFHINQRHWPAFNIADSAICVGAVLLIVDSLFGSSASSKTKVAADS